MVGRDLNIDLTVLQTMPLKEPTVVFRGSIPIAYLHKDIPQQQREALTVQTPHAQVAVLEGAVRVVSHLRQRLGKVRVFKEE
jgi:hypothetical protein